MSYKFRGLVLSLILTICFMVTKLVPFSIWFFSIIGGFAIGLFVTYLDKIDNEK